MNNKPPEQIDDVYSLHLRKTKLNPPKWRVSFSKAWWSSYIVLLGPYIDSERHQFQRIDISCIFGFPAIGLCRRFLWPADNGFLGWSNSLRKPAKIGANTMGTMKVIYQRETQSISLRTFPSNCTVRCLGTCMQQLLYIIFWLFPFFRRATSMLEVKSVEQQNQNIAGRVSISTLIKLTIQNSWRTAGVQHRRWILFLWGVFFKSPHTSWTKQMTLVKHVDRTTVWNIHGGSEHDD